MTADDFEALLSKHTYSYNGSFSCDCGVGSWPSGAGFRSHLAREMEHAVLLESPTPPRGVRTYSTFTLPADKIDKWLNGHREWVPVTTWPSTRRPHHVDLLCVRIDEVA